MKMLNNKLPVFLSWESIKEEYVLLVDSPTIQPNFSLITSERFDITHLDHGSSKVSSKIKAVGTVALHQLIAFTAITLEKLLVGMEETL
jgi:hypothetical protein